MLTKKRAIEPSCELFCALLTIRRENPAAPRKARLRVQELLSASAPDFLDAASQGADKAQHRPCAKIKGMNSTKRIIDQPLRDLEKRMPVPDEDLKKQFKRRHRRTDVIGVREAIREGSDFR